MNVISGFNGLRLDPVSENYHPGNGYRDFNPHLMRFTAPDSWSPFGRGGINSYAYCAGDPVNRADPSGHHSILGWLGAGVSLAMSILLTPFSGGSSLALVSVATALASTGLAVAQQLVAQSDPKTADILGWAALATGIVSGISSAALSHMMPEAKSLLSLLKGTSDRPFGGLMIEETAISSRTVESTSGFTPPQTLYPLGVVGCRHSLSFAKGRVMNDVAVLDVFGHGGYGADGVGYCNLDDRSLTATELHEHLALHVENYAEYNAVRIVTCFSADEGYHGESSLASQFAQISRKKIKAFNGIVNTRFLSGLTDRIMKGAAVERFREFDGDLTEIRRFLNERYPPLNTHVEVTGTARIFTPFSCR